MSIVGIDCGIARTGWSILENASRKVQRNGMKVLDYGVIETESDLDIPDRLEILYNEFVDILKKFKPSTLAIESIFYFKNNKTVINVSQARGVTILAARKKGLEVYDYTPLQVKQAITGYGKASKKQVQKMVKALLGLDEIPKPDDAADAIAVAVCHLNSLSVSK